MNITLHKNSERGLADHIWLQSRFSFSFANWYDPTKMGFGSLRVINDDIIAPESGFGMHEHKNMEIITIVSEGTVSHKDSMGNNAKVKAGEIQVMTAGSGVFHSEYNNSKDTTLKLFQIWITPRELNLPPTYSQKDFTQDQKQNALTLLVSADGSNNSLIINQDARIYRGVFDKEGEVHHSLFYPEKGVYIFVIKGAIYIENYFAEQGDALAITDAEKINIKAVPQTEILLFEL